MTWGSVTARRLQQHGLVTPFVGGQVADAAAAMCGAHAQILSAAELSIGLRLESVTRADVRDALWGDHSLIKTFGPRGTVHLLPARDLAMWTGALGTLPRGSSSFPEHVRLTSEQTEAVVVAIGEALEDAEVTVDELGEAVVQRAGLWAGELVMPASTRWIRYSAASSTPSASPRARRAPPPPRRSGGGRSGRARAAVRPACPCSASERELREPRAQVGVARADGRALRLDEGPSGAIGSPASSSQRAIRSASSGDRGRRRPTHLVASCRRAAWGRTPGICASDDVAVERGARARTSPPRRAGWTAMSPRDSASC